MKLLLKHQLLYCGRVQLEYATGSRLAMARRSAAAGWLGAEARAPGAEAAEAEAAEPRAPRAGEKRSGKQQQTAQQQAPTRSQSWPRAATVVSPRAPVRQVQAWELGRCACLAAWPVLPIIKSFDPHYCERVHRCSECCRPANNQTPTAHELLGTKRHIYNCKFEKERLRASCGFRP